ncbi:tail fiber assembly protein [Enterobacter mori]|uniref:Tail fiber assembly protein n=1 Tax=Enterobacter mori TaxID=539813 RepID=A0A9Q7JYH6_9ENTR|nr:tail fiber assembly protein [Enterobacter mori]MCC8232190.1 tail fiber assembly protein [Enterobacter mori]MCC8241685.1 tail fiber assembly protein [Enterobacter mori]RTQ19963.1 tail fiber assembly protein [Enterobacter mori]
MTQYFSPTALGFFVEGVNEVIPEDVVIVSDDVYQEFTSVAWPEGKVIGADDDGQPGWVDAPPLTREQEIIEANAQKQSLIDQTNAYINRKQWPGKAAIGRLKGDELEQYNEWLDYLDALEAVDTSTAPDISWPYSPDSV